MRWPLPRACHCEVVKLDAHAPMQSAEAHLIMCPFCIFALGPNKHPCHGFSRLKLWVGARSVIPVTKTPKKNGENLISEAPIEAGNCANHIFVSPPPTGYTDAPTSHF
ncbi:hypothetical protein IscW_ISCW023898 [Ixodes scapularis]|uniref:Uncharacterized protein n=1 Tax=Ixodes scapularis TaxID=6945 RepID=B7QN57_IXOSC|nr:hypothetical protein IscW_ISCW023898 [Ixodes scapularis]|eukprot:XP_002400692.1 hypothetical protein IscW_ISCW023898 [Ixodes scapularis]